MFAIFNNSEDSDKRNEAPLLQIFTEAQKQQKVELEKKVDALQKELDQLQVTALDGFPAWAAAFEKPVTTTALETEVLSGKGLLAKPLPGKITGLQVKGAGKLNERLTLKLRPKGQKISTAALCASPIWATMFFSISPRCRCSAMAKMSRRKARRSRAARRSMGRPSLATTATPMVILKRNP